MSVPIATVGLKPRRKTSIGVISEPPPIPVIPTRMPMKRPARDSFGSTAAIYRRIVESNASDLPPLWPDLQHWAGGASRAPLRRHERDRRAGAALQPGGRGHRRARRGHRRPVVAARAARRPARRRTHVRPALLPALRRLLRARAAALRRGTARGHAAAT